MRRRLDAAARDEEGLGISAISFWEVGVLSQKGRLELPEGLKAWREIVLAQAGVVEISVSSEIAAEAVDLPGPFHSDPADRLIVATARLTARHIVTVNERILAYAKQGHVRAF